MDNKRWYSRFGTIFWWTLAILPLIVVLIQFIGFHLTFNSGISSATDLVDYHSNENGDFVYLFYQYFSEGNYTFTAFSLSPIRSMYEQLFGLFNMVDPELSCFTCLFAWMTSVAFYHVLFDFSVWIFNWIHSFFDRWGCFK